MDIDLEKWFLDKTIKDLLDCADDRLTQQRTEKALVEESLKEAVNEIFDKRSSKC
jgi:hypothetical protein